MIRDIVNGALWISNNRLRRRFNVVGAPAFVSVALTWQCPSRCATCGIWRSEQSNEVLPLDIYARVLDDPLIRRCRVWEMTGGEPLMYPHLFELVDMAFTKLPHATIRIGTNCLLDDKLIRLIDLFEAFPLFLSLSIDGIGTRHDDIRGVKGNFGKVQRVIEHLRWVQANGSPIQFGASVCVSKLNVTHIPDLTAWLKRLNIPFQLTPVVFPPYAQQEHARVNRDDLDFLTIAERAAVSHLFNQYDKPTYQRFRRFWLKQPYSIPPCYALREYTHLRPNGDVEMCMWKPVSMGNLHTQSFSEIWHSIRAKAWRHMIRECTECAKEHPNMCDALNNYYFHGNLHVDTFKQRVKLP